MKTSSNGRALIEKYEGLILQSYDDANDHIVPVGGSSQGTLTIGYGHTSAAGSPKVTPGMKITKEQADSILASDLQKVEADVTRLVKVSLNQNEFDALVSFQFNTGSLGKSTALKRLNAGDYEGCADAFMMYTKGRVNGQLVPMRGLVTRRTEEKKLFMTPYAPVPTSKTVGNAPVTTAAGGAVAGGVAVYSYWDMFVQHWVLYSIGAVVLACVIDMVIHAYKNRKTTDAVV